MRRTARIAPALLLPFMVGCGTYAALDNASPDASRITNLHWLIFWITGGVSIVLIAALAIALISRRTSQTRAGEWLRTVAVAAAGVFSILVLLGLLNWVAPDLVHGLLVALHLPDPGAPGIRR